MNDVSKYDERLMLDLMLNPLYEVKNNTAAKALMRMIFTDIASFTAKAFFDMNEIYYLPYYYAYKKVTQNE